MKDEIPKERLLELLCDYNDFLIANGVVETNCIGKAIEFVNSKFHKPENTSSPVPNFGGVSKEDFEHIEIKMVHHKEVFTPSLFEIPSQPTIGVAVDCGSVNGKNPGIFEYRLVDIASKKVIKNVLISGESTNNIAEFLAIVDGLRYVIENNLDTIIYSDSRTAISWFKKKKCKTKFAVTDEGQARKILSAEKFLQCGYNVKVMFWNHKYFTENPADYNRK